MITTAYQIKQMSIARQEEPKNSFMGVSMELSVNKKKFHSHVYVCLYWFFELYWDLGDTPCPSNLAVWLEARPFAGCKRTCLFKINSFLTGR